MAKVSKYGQWQYPGEDTIIPNVNGSITMKGVPYPVLGIDDLGYSQMMMPGVDYQFPGNSVYEKPMNKITDPNVIAKLIEQYKTSSYKTGGRVLNRYQGKDGNSTVTGEPTPAQVFIPSENQWATVYNTGTGQQQAVGKEGDPYMQRFAFDEKGRLMSDKPMGDMSFTMPTVTIQDKAPEWAQYEKEFLQQYPTWESYGDTENPTSPALAKFFGGLLGLGKTRINPYTGNPYSEEARKTNWELAKQNYIAKKLLEANPEQENRLSWLQGFDPKEQEIIRGSRTYGSELDPNAWQMAAQGLYNRLPAMWGQGYKNPDERNLFPEDLSLEESKDAGLLDALGALAIPAKGVQGWITQGNSEGWRGGSPMPYGQNRDTFLHGTGQVVLDPLNLVGVGIGKGVVGAIPKTAELVADAGKGLRAVSEMGASGTAELLGKINPFLESKAGIFSREAAEEARLGFRPSNYVTRMDAEGARFGALEYQGKGPVDKYKAFAESNLPLPQLQQMAEQHGLQNAANMTKDQIVQAFKNEAVNTEYAKTLDPAQKTALEDAIFEDMTGQTMDEYLINNPYYTRTDVLGMYDINRRITQGTPEVNKILDKIAPNRQLGDIENNIDALANIGKGPGSEIVKPIDELEMPKGFVQSKSKSKAGNEELTNFSSLLGQTDSAGNSISGVGQKIIEDGIQAQKSYTQIVDELANSYAQELYNRGYSQKKIDEITTRFKEITNEGALETAVYSSPTFGITNPGTGPLRVEDIVGTADEKFLLDFLRNDVHPSLYGGVRRKMPDIFTQVERLGLVKDDGRSILKALDETNPNWSAQMTQDPHSTLTGMQAIDEQLAQVAKGDRAGTTKEIMNDIVKGNIYHPNQITNSYITKLLQGPVELGGKPIADFYSKAYGKVLSKDQANTLNKLYNEVYEIFRDKNVSRMGTVGVHQPALREIKVHPQTLIAQLNPDQKAALALRGIGSTELDDLSSALNAINKSDFLKPTLGETFSEIGRRGTSAGRTKQFVLPETKEALVGEVKRGKENLVNLGKKKTTPFAPSTEAPYKGHVSQLTTSLFASSFKNSREMAMYVKNALETGMSNAKVGTVLTGATNTSKDSYLIQMDFLMRIHAANPNSTKPVFLGFEPMNSYAFTSKYKMLDNEQTLNLINNKLNETQRATNVNFGFENKYPYINQNGNIMIPQWGLEKTQDVPIKIKKKKYGGEVGFNDKPFIGYIPFTHHQLK